MFTFSSAISQEKRHTHPAAGAAPGRVWGSAPGRGGAFSLGAGWGAWSFVSVFLSFRSAFLAVAVADLLARTRAGDPAPWGI